MPTVAIIRLIDEVSRWMVPATGAARPSCAQSDPPRTSGRHHGRDPAAPVVFTVPVRAAGAHHTCGTSRACGPSSACGARRALHASCCGAGACLEVPVSACSCTTPARGRGCVRVGSGPTPRKEPPAFRDVLAVRPSPSMVEHRLLRHRSAERLLCSARSRSLHQRGFQNHHVPGRGIAAVAADGAGQGPGFHLSSIAREGGAVFVLQQREVEGPRSPPGCRRGS